MKRLLVLQTLPGRAGLGEGRVNPLLPVTFHRRPGFRESGPYVWTESL